MEPRDIRPAMQALQAAARPCACNQIAALLAHDAPRARRPSGASRPDCCSRQSMRTNSAPSRSISSSRRAAARSHDHAMSAALEDTRQIDRRRRRPRRHARSEHTTSTVAYRANARTSPVDRMAGMEAVGSTGSAPGTKRQTASRGLANSLLDRPHRHVRGLYYPRMAGTVDRSMFRPPRD